MINRDRLVQTFLDLVRIDSPSGHEEAIAQDLTRRLAALEFQVQRDAYGNLIASESGAEPLILSAHLDTVEPGRGVKPQVQGDRIVSDGTTILGGDCKAGLTAILEALASIHEERAPRVPVQLVFTREEEIGLMGAKNLDFSLVRGRQAVVFDGEGAASHITSGSPTYLRFDVHITGRSAHAGVEPEKGLSAIRIAAEAIAQLPQGRLDPQTTFNVGMISGGSVRNAVPEKASFSGEMRSFNKATLDSLHQRVGQTLQAARQRYPDAVIEEKYELEFETYTLRPDDPIVARVKEALQSLGMAPTMAPSGGGTDGNVFGAHGIRAVVIGMGDRAAHTTREYVEIPLLLDTARFCQALLTLRR
jgi:tripeptide aminopeptidase